MTIPNLDMDALRTFLATQQLGSLNRAAERVGRSQSAVSQQMRKLEAQVGQPLFRRQGRGLMLTDAGELILSYAHRILDLNDEAVRAVRGASVEGVVRFGLPGDFAETWLPAALGQFKKTHPGVRVEVAVERNGVLLERLDRGELDLVLVMGNESRSDAEPLAMLPMTWIGPVGADIVLTPGVALDLALYNPPCFFRRTGIEALDAAGISWRLAYTTASLQSLWSGVAAGLGITLRTAAGLPSSLKRLGTKEGLPPLPSVALCLHAGHRDTSPALAQLKRVVTECAGANLAAA
ncbi:LysR substrate-binding domain-containing protein [Pandoraea sputorum]|uniref:HTH-type transcriptional activator CmpR n=1 Tax=Pandoraea sputorum TaxID=93222 RepID=A0A239SU67_9BURK|nr:LysR substrate-binding domain-containing protein [Pandoraea sputorum]AJC18382.1 LysR family transcriptional regulator [Pandoraea sputorum]SNU88284.1 HTH-type transcriptional activator CmpR [Pandoraea sputorum]VVE54141.1 LysR family transcriptional regulator [Pandoraea sputorum]